MNSILAIVLLGCVVAAHSAGLLGAGYGRGWAGRGGLGYGHGIGHGVGIGNGLGYGHGLGYGRRLGHGLGYGQGIGYGRRLGHGCAGYGCGVRRLGHGGLRGVGIHGLGRRGLGGLGIHGAIAGSYTARGANIGLNNAFEGSDEFVGVGNFNFQGAKGKAASHVPAGAAPATAPAVIGRQWGAGSARQWQAASADRAASGSGVAASARQASRTAQQEAQASFTQNAVSQGAGSAGAAYAFARNIPYNGIQAVGVAPANPQVGAADISVPANQAGGGAQVGAADIGAAVFANQRGDASVAGGAGYGDGGYGGKAY